MLQLSHSLAFSPIALVLGLSPDSPPLSLSFIHFSLLLDSSSFHSSYKHSLFKPFFQFQ